MADIAARIIATARHLHSLRTGDMSTAPFDYGYAVNGQAAQLDMGMAVHQVTGQDEPSAEVAAELAAYRGRCAHRSYTGWSDASRGPIRYA